MNIDFCQVFHHYIQINENWLSYGAGTLFELHCHFAFLLLSYNM